MELIAKSGEKVGTAVIEEEANTGNSSVILLSEHNITKEIFIRHSPQSLTLRFPAISDNTGIMKIVTLKFKS